MNNNNNNRRKKKNNNKNRYISHKRGLRVGCINVRGIVSNATKRVELNNWIELQNLDVVCIQEWFVPHGQNKQLMLGCMHYSHFELFTEYLVFQFSLALYNELLSQ